MSHPISRKRPPIKINVTEKFPRRHHGGGGYFRNGGYYTSPMGYFPPDPYLYERPIFLPSQEKPEVKNTVYLVEPPTTSDKEKSETKFYIYISIAVVVGMIAAYLLLSRRRKE
jgi:hypothetical protein